MRLLALDRSRLFLLVATTSVAAANFANAQAEPTAGTPTAAAPDLLDALLKQVDEAVDVNSRRYLVANSHSPWQIFHGILALRQNFQVKLGDQKVSAIDWVATAEPKFDNEPLIILTEHGANFHPFTRPYAFQGHPGQFLALLTPSNLPLEYKFQAGGKDITITDMLRDTMMNVNNQEEVTWVLWSLNHYLKSDASWVNKFGQPWSIEQLVQVESQAIVENAACGGNHGLFALSRALDKYLKAGQPLRGAWLQADMKIKRYTEISRSLQNRDGSFSANFYKGPEFSNDINTRLNSTGHTLEFLAASLPDARLREPWMQSAVQVLSHDLIQHKHQPVDCGPLYHSLNSLIIYRDRLRPGVSPQVVLKTANAGEAENQPQSDKASAPVDSTATTRRLIEGPISALEAINRR